MHGTVYKYPTLHKLNPYIYNLAWKAKTTYLSNFAYCIANFAKIKWPYRFLDREIRREYDAERRKLSKLIVMASDSAYSGETAVSAVGGLIQYSIIRKFKPKIVIETGVANGYSTRIILSALNRNKQGRRISVEVKKDVGLLLSGMDKSRWTLVVDKPRRNLRRAINSVKRVDVFIHDSDHTYKNMMFEFETVYDKMSERGFIMSDDVNWNAAFMRFSKRTGLQPMIFPSPKKSFGVLELGSKIPSN